MEQLPVILPTYTEIKKLFEGIDDINSVMSLLGKENFFDMDKYYLTALLLKVSASTSYEYHSKIVSPNKCDDSQRCTTAYTVLTIRRIATE